MTGTAAGTAAGRTAGRTDVMFRSGSDECAAWFYDASPGTQSDVEAGRPVIVMAHGLGGVREMRLDAFAERFAAAGYSCLVFDYRHFGGSGGQPRQVLDIAEQRADWLAAVTFARSLPGVDPQRVVAWGSSFGGGHAIATAARDHALVAAIAQCPFTDGLASALAVAPLTSARVTARALRDKWAERRGAEPVQIDLAAAPGQVALMTSPDAAAGYAALAPETGEVVSRVAARIGWDIAWDRPGRSASRVTCPILFTVCEHDSVAPTRATLRWARRAPRGEVQVVPYGHFDIYVGAAFEVVVAQQLEFLARHVPVAPA